ncbi:MAG: hypothetical protein AAGA81_08015 [Acidobacteriota bacterium]
MSLRSFHVVFIVGAVLLGVAFAGWALASGRTGLGVLSLVVSSALAGYCWFFVRRLQKEPVSD